MTMGRGRGRRPNRLRAWIDDETVRDLFLLARPLDLAGKAMAAARAIGDHPEIVTPDRMLPAALEECTKTRSLPGPRSMRCCGGRPPTFSWRAVPASRQSPATGPSPPRFRAIARIARGCAPSCRDPENQVGRFSVRKDRRKHLHRTIDGYELDIDHVTERRGSPYTLVCTKNRDGHRRRLREYAEDLRWMDSLLECAPEGPAGVALDEIESVVEGLGRAVENGRTAG